MNFRKSIEDIDIILNIIFDKNHIGTKKRKIEIEDIVILSLVEAINQDAKSMQLLIDKNILGSIQTIERSFLEKYIYLNFILQKNTKKRATAYFNHENYDALQKEKSYLEGINNKAEKLELREILDRKATPDDKFSSFEEKLTYYRKKYVSMFWTGSKHSDRSKWYNFERPEYKNRGIRDLANSIGNEGLHSYLGLYNPLAGSVHGYNSTANIRMFNRGDGTIDLGIANNVNPEEVEEFARNHLDRVIQLLILFYKLEKNSKVMGIWVKIKINARLQKNDHY